MDFKHVEEGEWRALCYAKKNSESIRAKALRVVELLDGVFSGGGDEGESGLEFRACDEPDVIAAFQSPVGGGRIRLEWAVIDGALVGVMVADRGLANGISAAQWEPVWRLNVPEHENPYIMTGNGRFSVYTHVQSGASKVRATVYEAGMSMLCAVVGRP